MFARQALLDLSAKLSFSAPARGKNLSRRALNKENCWRPKGTGCFNSWRGPLHSLDGASAATVVTDAFMGGRHRAPRRLGRASSQAGERPNLVHRHHLIDKGFGVAGLSKMREHPALRGERHQKCRYRVNNRSMPSAGQLVGS